MLGRAHGVPHGLERVLEAAGLRGREHPPAARWRPIQFGRGDIFFSEGSGYIQLTHHSRQTPDESKEF